MHLPQRRGFDEIHKVNGGGLHTLAIECHHRPVDDTYMCSRYTNVYTSAILKVLLALHKEMPIAMFVHTMKNAFPLAKKWEYGLTICEERGHMHQEYGHTYHSTY